MIQILQIHYQFLDPKCGSFTYGSRLRRLEMSKCQSRKIFILHGKFRQNINYIHQFFLYQLQRLCHNDHIGVVSYIAGSCAQVDDSCCLRTLFSISIYMAHYIMTDLFFSGFCHIIVNVVNMSFQFFNLLVRNARVAICIFQSQFFFCFCQSNPQSSPCAELHIRRKNVLHLFTGISL